VGPSMKKELKTFDSKISVKIILLILYLSCAFLFLLDFLLHKHIYFNVEVWSGFYAVFGFVSSVVIILIAKFLLRRLVMRQENYYDK